MRQEEKGRDVIQGTGKALALALGVWTLLFLSCFALLSHMTDVPSISLSGRPNRERRAVVAIRDPEKPFMQWGTRLFTWPYLSRHYGRAWLFTQASKEDQKEAIVAAMNEALRSCDSLDLFLLAHSNSFHEWVGILDEELRRKKLRMVYNTGCYNARQGETWLELGAKTYIGHPGNSVSPPFYVFYTRRWVKGSTVRDAFDEGNALAKRLFDRLERVMPSKIDSDKVWQTSHAILFGAGEMSIGDRP